MRVLTKSYIGNARRRFKTSAAQFPAAARVRSVAPCSVCPRDIGPTRGRTPFDPPRDGGPSTGCNSRNFPGEAMSQEPNETTGRLSVPAALAGSFSSRRGRTVQGGTGRHCTFACDFSQGCGRPKDRKLARAMAARGHKDRFAVCVYARSSENSAVETIAISWMNSNNDGGVSGGDLPVVGHRSTSVKPETPLSVRHDGRQAQVVGRRRNR